MKRLRANILAFSLGLLPINARAAEKIVVPTFKNVDEAIGWVKAKGSCENFGKEQRDSRCNIRLDLPDQKTPENQGESVWHCWAWMNTFDSEFFRTFTVVIVRSKNFPLLANDSKAMVRSVRVSTYSFDKSGKMHEASVDFTLENFKGERILRQSIPVPIDSFARHGDGAEDLGLFRSQLGVDWDYLRGNTSR